MDMLETDVPNAGRANKLTSPVRDWNPGSYRLRDAWFPLAHSESVRKRPVKRLVHSQPYYLVRDAQGKALATEFHPERFAEQRRLASEFTGGTGEYPVTEIYGYVWCWYGDPARADLSLIPDIPYLPRKGGLPGYMRSTTRFDSCSELSLENLLDLTHADYLHTYLTGDEECDSDTVTVEYTSETVTMIRDQINKKTPDFMKKMGVKSERLDFRGVIHVYVRSSVAHAFGRFTPGYSVPLFHPCVPESQFQNRLNVTINSWDAPWLFKHMMPLQGYTVSPQDNYVTRPQNARYLEPTDRRDMHSRFDGAGIRYRFLMQQLAERQSQGDYSYLPDADIGRDLTELFRTIRVE